MRPQRWQPTRLPCPWDSPGKNTGVGCHFLLQCMKVKSESEGAQSYPTLSNPMDCSLPGSSIHGIFQARVLEWAATAFSAQGRQCVLNEKQQHHTWHTTAKIWKRRQPEKASPFPTLLLLGFRPLHQHTEPVHRRLGASTTSHLS